MTPLEELRATVDAMPPGSLIPRDWLRERLRSPSTTQDDETEWVLLAEGRGISSYSISHLRRLIRLGRLTARGSGRDLQVRRSELPRKPGRLPGPDLVGPALVRHR